MKKNNELTEEQLAKLEVTLNQLETIESLIYNSIQAIISIIPEQYRVQKTGRN